MVNGSAPVVMLGGPCTRSPEPPGVGITRMRWVKGIYEKSRSKRPAVLELKSERHQALHSALDVSYLFRPIFARVPSVLLSEKTQKGVDYR